MVCALSLMSLSHPQKNYLAERCRAGVLAASQWMFSQAIRYAKNEQKSRFLLTQNVKLALDNMRLREAAWENLRLREALAFRRKDGAPAVIPAEVLGRDPDQIYDAIVINAGGHRELLRICRWSPPRVRSAMSPWWEILILWCNFSCARG